MTDVKECNRCGRVLPVTMFYRNRKSADGLHSHCKECLKMYEQERRDRRVSQPVKECNLCGEVKPLSEFNKNRRNADKHACRCKECNKIYMRSYHAKKRAEKNEISNC